MEHEIYFWFLVTEAGSGGVQGERKEIQIDQMAKIPRVEPASEKNSLAYDKQKITDNV